MKKILIKRLLILLILIIFSTFNFANANLYSVSLFQEDLRTAISNLAYDTGTTIIMDPKIAGFVTLDAVDKPLETLLDMILMPFGYAWKRIDDYILVGVPDPSSGTSIHLNDTYVMKTRYLTPKSLMQLLPRYFQNFVSYSEQDRNFVVINAPPKIAGTIANTIRKIDMGRAELSIEVKVVQIDTEEFKKWNISKLEITQPYDRGNGYNNSPHTQLSDKSLDFLANLNGVDYGLIIDKAISEGHGEVVSNSKINVISGENSTLSGKLVQSTNDQKVVGEYSGFELSLSPYLMSGKKVRLNATVLLKDKRSVENDSYLENKIQSTFVLDLEEEGTIAAFNYSTVVQKSIGIPFLSDIPGIGSLFKTSIDKKTDQQIIFLVKCYASGGEIQ
ncbi:hypothetical protein OSSY52_04480 [Tepiditoga spiralis]|uniref:Type II/III secretion system secretin-like domain-containing protein n=1 Tax=Tepiditoga spiralis TaxID=2108365 RepID=A0A7G1G637_9BACT|nr:hypothetical protein [Tepiditoga spiralis]BBE30307.1 hypothetical protein OSSY52_04480 [Tepiditoga spiralis]